MIDILLPAIFNVIIYSFSPFRYLFSCWLIRLELICSQRDISLKLYHYLALRIAAIAAISERASLHLLGDLSCK